MREVEREAEVSSYQLEKSKIKHLINQPNNMTISINKISWKNLKDILMYDLIFSILVFPVILKRTLRLVWCV